MRNTNSPRTRKATAPRVKQKAARKRYSGEKSAFATIMRHRKISNADIARYMAVNERTVVKWYGNPFALTLRQLTQLSGLFGCSVHYLIHSLLINNTAPENTNRATAEIEADKVSFAI